MVFFDDEGEYIQNLHKKSILSASFWNSFIGILVRHKKYSKGIIKEFRLRKNAEPVFKIQFDKNKFEKEFLFSNFEKGQFYYSKDLQPKLERYTEAKNAREIISKLKEIYKDFDWQEYYRRRWNIPKGYAGSPGTGKGR